MFTCETSAKIQSTDATPVEADSAVFSYFDNTTSLTEGTHYYKVTTNPTDKFGETIAFIPG